MSPPRRVTYMQRGAEPRGSAPLTAGLLVAAEVGHGLVQPRATDAHEREEHQASGQGDAEASNEPGLAHEDHRHGGQDGHQQRERVADVAAKRRHGYAVRLGD